MKKIRKKNAGKTGRRTGNGRIKKELSTEIEEKRELNQEDQDYTCPLCKKGLDTPVEKVTRQEYQGILKKIKKDYPEWEEDSGACVECLAYYGVIRARDQHREV